MSMIAHPMTEGSDGTPKYSARDVRNMLNTFLAPSDGSGPINTVIEGVKLTSDQPICTVSGRTATIKTHIGVINPYPAAGPYTYYSSDMPVTLPNTTQSWKIAVLIDDPSEGHGSSPQVRLDTYLSSTPDSDIYGMVLAVVHDGIADDVAPRLLINPTLIVNDLSTLNGMTAVNGQKAKIRNSTSEYEYRNGSWVCTYKLITIPGMATQWWHSNDLRMVKHGDVVAWSLDMQRRDSVWNGDNGNTLAANAIPVDMRPSQAIWAYLDNRFGLYLMFDNAGSVKFGRDVSKSYTPMGVGQVVDMTGAYVLGMGPIRS